MQKIINAEKRHRNQSGFPWKAGFLLMGALAAAGCGRRPPERFFEYDSGKINLERVTYVTPRIRVGINEFPLTDAGIATVIGYLHDGRWSYFDVQVQIFFDEFLWRVYRSDAFDPKDNPLTEKDIKAIERKLKTARKRFLSIR